MGFWRSKPSNLNLIVLFTRAYFLLNKEDLSVHSAHTVSADYFRGKRWFIVHRSLSPPKRKKQVWEAEGQRKHTGNVALYFSLSLVLNS